MPFKLALRRTFTQPNLRKLEGGRTGWSEHPGQASGLRARPEHTEDHGLCPADELIMGSTMNEAIESEGTQPPARRPLSGSPGP
jgi:hypothetical protein